MRQTALTSLGSQITIDVILMELVKMVIMLLSNMSTWYNTEFSKAIVICACWRPKGVLLASRGQSKAE